MPSYILDLTESEVLWLVDHTSIFSPTPDPDQGIPIMQHLRLKLLSTLLEAPFQGRLTMTQDEMWVSLETAKFSAQMGTEKVGLGLIHKLGTGLLAVSADSEVHTAITQCGEDESEKPTPNRFSHSEKIAEFIQHQEE